MIQKSAFAVPAVFARDIFELAGTPAAVRSLQIGLPLIQRQLFQRLLFDLQRIVTHHKKRCAVVGGTDHVPEIVTVQESTRR